MSDMSYTTKEKSQFMNVQGGEKKVMKKILSVALSTAMAFSMFASVAFGETAKVTPQQAFDALAAKGVVNGFPDGQAHLEKDLTRGEFAKIVTKLFGLTEVTGKLSYKDKGYDAKNWAVPYIEAVTAAGLMQGQDTVKGLFNFNGKVTVEEVSKVLAIALKLEQPTTTDNSASVWAKGYAQAVINAGLVAKDYNFKANATRSLVIETAYYAEQIGKVPTLTVASAEAVSPTQVVVTFSDKTTANVELTTALVEGVEQTINFKHLEKDYTAKVTLQAPKVVAVEAPNSKQLVVKFNRAISTDSLISDDKVIANTIKVVTVTGTNNVTVAGAHATVNAGGNEATITFPSTEFMKGQYSVVVTDAVKTSSGTAFATYTTLLNVADTTAPTVVSATAVAKTTTNTVTVKVSEPVKKAGIIAYVNGAAASATVSDDTYDTITLTTGAALNSGSSYDVSLLNVSDYAGNIATPNPIKTTVAVTSDTAAPSITKIVNVSDKYFDITFNKKVSYQSFVANVRLLNVYGESQGTLSVKTTKDSDTIRLQVPAGFKVPDTAAFTGNLVFAASVKDTLGNTLGTALTQPVTITKDTVAPTVISAVYGSKGLVVTFSENILSLSGAPTLINESTGQLVNANFASPSIDGAKVTYPNVAALSGSYTLRLPAAFVVDDSLTGNKSAATTVTVTAAAASTTDTERPTVTSVSYKETTANGKKENVVIVVSAQDNKGLNVASLRDLNSYTLDGKALPNTAYSFITKTTGDNSSAPLSAELTITIPSSSITESKTYNFVASGIVDTAGNGIVAFPQNMSLTDGVAPTLTGATVSTGDTQVLVLSFSEKLDSATVQKEDFEFIINGVATTAQDSLYTANTVTAGAGNDSGKYYVTFTVKATGKLLDLNANNINTVKVKVNTTSNITDTSKNVIVTGTEVDAK
ncbi:hypothetical protein [Paenibacillus sp. FSL R7-0179]|uniref:hypothetical protein n=1 Tax=Paenibacillus sp. FSL R7-0179 TaxID=2921672 RepID=UPI0030FC4346